MSLASFKKLLKKSYVWSVQHWRWLVFILASLLAYLAGRKNSKSLRIQAESARDQYKKEAGMLEKEHKEKQSKLEKAKKLYTKALSDLDEKYDDSASQLKREKDKHYRVLLEKAKKDPEQLSSLLKDMGIEEV